ncbi:MAG: sulfotransferase [Marinicellaceae bacterium]
MENKSINSRPNQRKHIHYQFIIILGCQRSGTTLTGQILGNHNQTFLIDENDGDGMCQWFKTWLKNPVLNDEKFLDVQKKASKKYISEQKTFVNQPLPESYSIILKAPNLTLLPDILSHLTPKPIIIFPVRDVRSVVSSMIKLNKTIMINRQTQLLNENHYICKNYSKELALLNSLKTPIHVRAALIWLLKNNMYDVFQNYGLTPYLFQYEDLISHKSSVVKDLINHCNLDYEESILNYHLTMKGKGPGKTLRDRKIDNMSINKWHNNLSTQQVKDIMSVSINHMQKLGYQS